MRRMTRLRAQVLMYVHTVPSSTCFKCKVGRTIGDKLTVFSRLWEQSVPISNFRCSLVMEEIGPIIIGVQWIGNPNERPG